MNESATLTVGWKLAGRRILETLDDGGLSGTIVTDDQGQWGVELNGFTGMWAEGTDTRNGELVNS